MALAEDCRAQQNGIPSVSSSFYLVWKKGQPNAKTCVADFCSLLSCSIKLSTLFLKKKKKKIYIYIYIKLFSSQIMPLLYPHMVFEEVGLFPIFLFTLAMDLSNRQEGHESGKSPFYRQGILRLFFFFSSLIYIETRSRRLEEI